MPRRQQEAAERPPSLSVLPVSQSVTQPVSQTCDRHVSQVSQPGQSGQSVSQAPRPLAGRAESARGAAAPLQQWGAEVGLV
jgi:hypothetical protein